MPFVTAGGYTLCYEEHSDGEARVTNLPREFGAQGSKRSPHSPLHNKIQGSNYT